MECTALKMSIREVFKLFHELLSAMALACGFRESVVTLDHPAYDGHREIGRQEGIGQN